MFVLHGRMWESQHVLRWDVFVNWSVGFDVRLRWIASVPTAMFAYASARLVYVSECTRTSTLLRR